ncbi:MAG: DUF1501 domain-containing protein, partial [Planctomycetaceae bacterium]|nr:DUF1501 domain-containing protein [Planctomycetaceae bacterium]
MAGNDISVRSPLLGSRREFLTQAAGGFGAAALAALMHQQSVDGADALASKSGHHPATATAVIHIFCPGGMSQVDTWDYRPELARRQGQPFDPDGQLQFFASKPGNCQGSYWKFRQHGECGRWISDLFPQLATCVDDMAFIHSMQSKSALHGPAMFMANSGYILPGFPSMGAWVTYGLGSLSDNLPAFVVLPDPRGLPPGGVINWGAGFLPAVHQGTTVNAGALQSPMTDLFPPESFRQQTSAGEQPGRDFLRQLNQTHAAEHPGNTELEARIAAYELAARLQLSVPEVTDLSQESAGTMQQYAVDDEDRGPFGRQCLLARRLVERGVRFVQIYCGAENTTARKIRPNWD